MSDSLIETLREQNDNLRELNQVLREQIELYEAANAALEKTNASQFDAWEERLRQGDVRLAELQTSFARLSAASKHLTTALVTIAGGNFGEATKLAQQALVNAARGARPSN